MSWASELEKAGVPAAVQKLIIEQGYDSAAVFHNAFVNGAALEGWLVRIQKDIEAYKNLNTEEWATHPVAAKLRILWKGLGSEQAATGTPVSSLALAVKQNLAPAKLSTSDRDRLRKEVEKRFPSHVFGPDTLPSMPFLQLIHSQCLGLGVGALAPHHERSTHPGKPRAALCEQRSRSAIHCSRFHGCAEGRAAHAGSSELCVPHPMSAGYAWQCVCNVQSRPPGNLGNVHQKVFALLH